MPKVLILYKEDFDAVVVEKKVLKHIRQTLKSNQAAQCPRILFSPIWRTSLIQLLLELVLKEELVDAYQLNTIQKFPEKYFDFLFSVKLKVLYLKSRSE